MKRRDLLAAGATLGIPSLGLMAPARAQEPDDTDAPGMPAPKGAIVLLDGKDLSKWVSRNGGGPAAWTIENGYVEVMPGKGDIYTTEMFRDFQLHVEFWLPLMADAKGQARSNSGVYMQGKYEVQVLDSYGIEDPADNDAGGIYKTAKPLRNASRKPEKWQTYDIAFRAPRFDGEQQKEKGRITVFFNGIMIHNNQEFDANVTTSGMPGDVTKPGPILLQDHGNKIRYRNIWILPVKA